MDFCSSAFCAPLTFRHPTQAPCQPLNPFASVWHCPSVKRGRHHSVNCASSFSSLNCVHLRLVNCDRETSNSSTAVELLDDDYRRCVTTGLGTLYHAGGIVKRGRNQALIQPATYGIIRVKKIFRGTCVGTPSAHEESHAS